MTRRPPRSTRTDTLFPYTTLFRSRGLRLHAPGERQVADRAEADGALLHDLARPARVVLALGEQHAVALEDAALVRERSDERRVGKEGVSKCRSRVSPYHSKKKQ